MYLSKRSQEEVIRKWFYNRSTKNENLFIDLCVSINTMGKITIRCVVLFHSFYYLCSRPQISVNTREVNSGNSTTLIFIVWNTSVGTYFDTKGGLAHMNNAYLNFNFLNIVISLTLMIPLWFMEKPLKLWVFSIMSKHKLE